MATYLDNPTPIDLTPSGFAGGLANGVSNGVQVGVALGGQAANESRAMRWHGTASSAVNIHPPGYASSQAFAIDGDYIAGEVTTTQSMLHAALWTVDEGTFVDIHPQGYDLSIATGVSGNQIVGGAFLFGVPSFPEHAALWLVSGGFVDLNPAGFKNSRATATNGTQQIGYAVEKDDYDNLRPFIWSGTAESGVNLAQYMPSDLHSILLTGINDEGVIVGHGQSYDPAIGGIFRSFALIPMVPEPSAIGLLTVASTALLKRRRR